ncbi:30S ribosomal protein S1 [Chromobacterium violaceum]|uniref:30S ribosomal protein S1 n=1 Tax=Chromobacterium violaceum TaxID=536 RepID=A0A3S4HP25_CHRVL|nr:30S ribosomal protein S1 [Chromobacterium violaceum]
MEDARSVLKDGDAVEAVIVAVDRKSRNISLSIKAKDAQEDNAALKSLAVDSASAGTTNLGALLKAKLSGSNE